MIQFSVLGSGSKGNSVLIEGGGTTILLDAGFSGKEIAKRIKIIGKNIDDVEALFITHEHNDHIAGAGVLSRRLDLPVYANVETLRAGEEKLKKLHKTVEFSTGDILTPGALEIRSFRTSHDTADPLGYVVSDGKHSLGYLTDTGTITQLMLKRLQRCDALILEFNHDLEMLKNGPYPLPLQQRVRSGRGHLCNTDAADFLRQLSTSPASPLRHLILAHLSEKNNTPQLALAAASHAVAGGDISLTLALQHQPLPPISLG